jgi:hypothetical protein
MVPATHQCVFVEGIATYPAKNVFTLSNAICGPVRLAAPQPTTVFKCDDHIIWNQERVHMVSELRWKIKKAEVCHGFAGKEA